MAIDRSALRQVFKRAGMKLRRRERLLKPFLYIFLIAVSFAFLYPFLYMLITSVKSMADLNDVTVNWAPRELYWQNYATALKYLDVGRHLLNSLIITGLTTLGHLLSGSFIAYGFARFKFRGRGLLFGVVILSILIPAQVIVLPQYSYYLQLNWMNTYLPIILPAFFGFGLRGGMYIFIFRQFFFGLPKELEEAATIDGCGYFGTYWRIILPNVKSAFLVCAFISIVWHWNDYFEPSIYLSFADKLPLPSMLCSVCNGLTDYFKNLSEGKLDMLVTEGVIMAAITICITPLILVFAFLQRSFVEGVERTGLVE